MQQTLKEKEQQRSHLLIFKTGIEWWRNRGKSWPIKLVVSWMLVFEVYERCTLEMRFTGDAIYSRWTSSDGDIFEEDICLMKLKILIVPSFLVICLLAKEELFENQCYSHALKSETSMPQTLKEEERRRRQLLVFKTGIEWWRNYEKSWPIKLVVSRMLVFEVDEWCTQKM